MYPSPCLEPEHPAGVDGRRWRRAPGNERLGGCFRLASIESLLQPVEAGDEAFMVLDAFADEACVGYPEGSNALHFYDFENATYPLLLDFAGYFALLEITHGFWYWQKVLLEHNQGIVGPVTQHFQETMPTIFPDFVYADFIARYEEVKLAAT